MRTITRHAETPCPVCKHPLNASSRFREGGTPKAGDLSVCINCGTTLRYSDEFLHLRPMTKDEIRSLNQEEIQELREYQSAVVLANTIRKGESN